MNSQDDVSALDLPTIKAWCLILRLTIAEYLGLDPMLASEKADGNARRRADELVSHSSVCPRVRRR